MKIINPFLFMTLEFLEGIDQITEAHKGTIKMNSDPFFPLRMHN